MSTLLQTTHITVSPDESKSSLALEVVTGPGEGPTGRFLLLDGQQVYCLGAPCRKSGATGVSCTTSWTDTTRCMQPPRPAGLSRCCRF